MLFPISITIDSYVQAESLEDAERIADNLELRILEFQDIRTPSDPLGVQLEQCEIVEKTVLNIDY